MSRLKTTHQAISVASIATGAALTNVVSNWFRTVSESNSLSFVLTIIVVGIGYQGVKLVLEFVFERNTLLRKWILGTQYVEGRWISVVRDQQGHILNYGLKSIEPKGESLLYSGENYDPKNRMHQGYFASELLMFEWPRIRYKYSYSRPDNEVVSKEGYGELQFVSRNGPPFKHSGFFIDLLEGTRYTFEGWKVTDPKLIEDFDDYKMVIHACLQQLGIPEKCYERENET